MHKKTLVVLPRNILPMVELKGVITGFRTLTTHTSTTTCSVTYILPSLCSGGLCSNPRLGATLNLGNDMKLLEAWLNVEHLISPPLMGSVQSSEPNTTISNSEHYSRAERPTVKDQDSSTFRLLWKFSYTLTKLLRNLSTCLWK